MTIMQNTQWAVATTPAPQDDGKQLNGQFNIQNLIDRNAAFDAFKSDYEVKAFEFDLNNDGRFTLPNTDTMFTIEDPALRQLCARYGHSFMDSAIPFNYARALIDNVPSMYKAILADHAADYGKSVFIRTYDDTVRGFMSDRFTHIDNSDVLGMLRDYLGDKGGNYELVRPYVGRDSMNIRIMVKAIRPPDSDSPYGMGCVVRTGEIGNVSPQVLPFIQRGVCTNSTVWQEGGITLKQAGNRESKLMLLAAAMGEALSASSELVKRMLTARYEQLPKLTDIVSSMADEFGWGEEVKLNVVLGTDHQDTLAGLVNGITFSAHKSDLSADNALAMELFGGKVLMNAELVRKYR